MAHTIYPELQNVPPDNLETYATEEGITWEDKIEFLEYQIESTIKELKESELEGTEDLLKVLNDLYEEIPLVNDDYYWKIKSTFGKLKNNTLGIKEKLEKPSKNQLARLSEMRYMYIDENVGMRSVPSGDQVLMRIALRIVREDYDPEFNSYHQADVLSMNSAKALSLLKKAQRKLGLEADGKFGPKTFKALMAKSNPSEKIVRRSLDDIVIEDDTYPEWFANLDDQKSFAKNKYDNRSA